jgi:hypothetical protein
MSGSFFDGGLGGLFSLVGTGLGLLTQDKPKEPEPIEPPMTPNTPAPEEDDLAAEQDLAEEQNKLSNLRRRQTLFTPSLSRLNSPSTKLGS